MSDFCKGQFLRPEMWNANADHVQFEPDGDESRFMSTAIRFDGCTDAEEGQTKSGVKRTALATTDTGGGRGRREEAEARLACCIFKAVDGRARETDGQTAPDGREKEGSVRVRRRRRRSWRNNLTGFHNVNRLYSCVAGISFANRNYTLMDMPTASKELKLTVCPLACVCASGEIWAAQ